ncbi:MAG: hypothetical protein J5797_11075 [Prevotella sp.]|nr:hypothetical protein [Prevotella sp.]
MKKTYINPAIEVILVKSPDLMVTSVGVYDTEIEAKDMLSRDVVDFGDDSFFDE